MGSRRRILPERCTDVVEEAHRPSAVEPPHLIEGDTLFSQGSSPS